MNRTFLMKLTATLTLLVSCLSSHSEVKPNGLFSSGAVLQQGKEVPVWGEAKDGEVVTVKILDQTATATAKEGRWMVRLQPLRAGGPFTMTIAGENTVTLTNLLVGEVWVCSGQSNMGFPLGRADNGPTAIAASADPRLRLFSLPTAASNTPQTLVRGSWKEAGPSTVVTFSAVAYFFGRDLRKALGVPVGLIQSAVGGTPAEAWTSQGTLESDPDLKKILDRHSEAVRRFDPGRAAAAREKSAKKLEPEKGKGAGKGGFPSASNLAVDPARATTRPCGLYNGMIAPLQPYAMAGVIWYQGEANSGRAAEYRKLFPKLISDWRQAWRQGEFPFLFVQIAPEYRMTPEIREAQLLTWQRVPQTAMVVTTDVGDERDIHPVRKEPVGARLALAARAIAYGETIEYSGPVFQGMKLEESRVVLSFTHIGGGLAAMNGDLKGFELAGEDGQFVAAAAVIQGDTVVVSSPEVTKPVSARYGWKNAPKCNLVNKAGLPASPFRTDPPALN